MTIRKTGLMLKVEGENGGELIETLVPRQVQEKGLSKAASELGVSKGTLSTWVLKLGLNYNVERTLTPLVAAGAGEPSDS